MGRVWLVCVAIALLGAGAVNADAGPAQPADTLFVKPDTTAEVMYADQADCEADARYSRVVTYANLSAGAEYNHSNLEPT